MAELRRCQFAEEREIWGKSIGGIALDPSEFTDPEKGCVIMTEDIHCNYVADPGERFCPRHKLLAAQKERAA
jgi:hypothetical protein